MESCHSFWNHFIDIGIFVLGSAAIIYASAILAFKDFGDD